jgi:hypothetical protein
MRNYPAFPRATPHQWAGSPRVPHPSATFVPEGTTFDLHALGTPPALILSQDQTLHQNCVAPLALRHERTWVHFCCVRHHERPIEWPRSQRSPARSDASVLHLRPPVRSPPHRPRRPPRFPGTPQESMLPPAANLSMCSAVSTTHEQKKTAPVRAGAAKPRRPASRP